MSTQTTNDTVSESARRYGLAHLSDGDLLTGTRRLVGCSNQLFADLLAHLAEVEARGIHRTCACSSLYTYCIYELRFSEDAAFRRASAARLVQIFPALLGAVAGGELHLTGLLMLGPHLTQANHREVLARAKHRTKKEIAELIRRLDPLPDVPPRIEPLGPAPERRVNVLKNPTWQEFVTWLAPVVRELAAGERPRDWIDEATLADAANGERELEVDASPVLPASFESTVSTGCDRAATEPALASLALPFSIGCGEGAAERALATLAPPESAFPAGPPRYRVQFTATEEYVKLVERAKALLSHAHTGSSLVEVHLRAMQELVAQLEKRKYAVKRPATKLRLDAAMDAEAPTETETETETEIETQTETQTETEAQATDVAAETPHATPEPASRAARWEEATRQRGRYVPAPVRRELYERDEARCTYVDSSGERCRETHWLEVHHQLAFANRGRPSIENLTLRCRAHNALAAEEDFGRARVERQRNASAHEPERKQRAP